MKISIRARKRSGKGSGIIEATVGLWLIISGTVAAVLLLVNTGVASYYKGKLGFITQQAAIYASNHAASPFGINHERVASNTKSRVAELCQAMGLPKPIGNDVIVSFDSKGNSVSVSLQLSALRLIGDGSILPAFVPVLRDSSTALIDDTRPKYTCAISMVQNNGTAGQGFGGVALVPAYKEFAFNGAVTYQVLSSDETPPTFATLGMSGDGCYTAVRNSAGNNLAPPQSYPPQQWASLSSCVAGQGLKN